MLLLVRRIKRTVGVWRIGEREIDAGINRVAALGTVTHLRAPLGIWRDIVEIRGTSPRHHSEA